MFDQLGPTPNRNLERNSVAADISTLGNVYSSQLSATIDLEYLEVTAMGSHRLVPDLSGLSTDLQQVVEQERSMLGVQLGRHLARDNQYGIFGLGYYLFFPNSDRQWLGIHIDTGLAPSTTSPWRAHFRLAAFFPFKPDSQLAQASIKALYRVAGSSETDFALGARFLWSMFFRPKGDGVQREHLMAALGPAAQLTAPWGTLNLEIAWRWWLDKHFNPITSVTVGSISGAPDFRLNWTIHF